MAAASTVWDFEENWRELNVRVEEQFVSIALASLGPSAEELGSHLVSAVGRPYTGLTVLARAQIRRASLNLDERPGSTTLTSEKTGPEKIPRGARLPGTWAAAAPFAAEEPTTRIYIH